jgi:hypothetical protein
MMRVCLVSNSTDKKFRNLKEEEFRGDRNIVCGRGAYLVVVFRPSSKEKIEFEPATLLYPYVGRVRRPSIWADQVRNTLGGARAGVIFEKKNQTTYSTRSLDDFPNQLIPFTPMNRSNDQDQRNNATPRVAEPRIT